MATTRGRMPRGKGQASGSSVSVSRPSSPETDTQSQLALPSEPLPPDYEVPGPNGLSRELADRLVEARRTMPRRFAATYCGVSPKTFKRWLEIGSSSAHDPVCVYFCRRISETEGTDVSETIAGLQLLRAVNPQASDVYLKIMHPEDFGGHTRTTPDEFEGNERNRDAQDRLLDNPPPRMLAKLREYRWIQIPEGASIEEIAEIEAKLHSIRMRITTDNAEKPE